MYSIRSSVLVLSSDSSLGWQGEPRSDVIQGFDGCRAVVEMVPCGVPFRFWNLAFLLIEYKIMHACWWYDITAIAFAPTETPYVALERQVIVDP